MAYIQTCEQPSAPLFVMVVLFTIGTVGYFGYVFLYDYNGDQHIMRKRCIIFCSWTLGFGGLCGSCDVNPTERSEQGRPF